LIGYALKKVVKLVAVVVGLFFTGLVYLQYQQILNINRNKLQAVSHNTLSILSNATKISGLGSTADHIESLAVTNIGIPFTGSISMGFAIGFIRGQ
jgi:uncharacterized membrane protein (Fun14 family)